MYKQENSAHPSFYSTISEKAIFHSDENKKNKEKEKEGLAINGTQERRRAREREREKPMDHDFLIKANPSLGGLARARALLFTTLRRRVLDTKKVRTCVRASMSVSVYIISLSRASAILTSLSLEIKVKNVGIDF